MKPVEYTEDEDRIMKRYRVFGPQIVQTRQQAKIKKAEEQELAAIKEPMRLKRNDQQRTQFGNRSSAKDIAASYGFLNENTYCQSKQGPKIKKRNKKIMDTSSEEEEEKVVNIQPKPKQPGFEVNFDFIKESSDSNDSSNDLKKDSKKHTEKDAKKHTEKDTMKDAKNIIKKDTKKIIKKGTKKDAKKNIKKDSKKDAKKDNNNDDEEDDKKDNKKSKYFKCDY